MDWIDLTEKVNSSKDLKEVMKQVMENTQCKGPEVFKEQHGGLCREQTE